MAFDNLGRFPPKSTSPKRPRTNWRLTPPIEVREVCSPAAGIAAKSVPHPNLPYPPCQLVGGYVLRLLTLTLALVAISVLGIRTGESFSSGTVSHCQSARQAIVFYRQSTWSWQDRLYQHHTRTAYSERRKHAGCAYLRWSARLWVDRNERARSRYSSIALYPVEAIKYIFGRDWQSALHVAYCESRLYTGATNGQYLGLFQMGKHERRLYGHGSTSLEQAHAAYEYYVDSGKDWSPWSCKP